MRKVFSQDSSNVRRVKITEETREAYANRDKSLDRRDPDCPTMPPDFWKGAQIGKFRTPTPMRSILPRRGPVCATRTGWTDQSG